MSCCSEVNNKNLSHIESASVKIFKSPNFQDGLVLYFHPFNFYSQKVLLTLYEKKIEFIPYVIDLSNGEQYSSWFLNLNPKGDVPVLQDGSLIIPESSHIINYVEDKFRADKYIELKPKYDSKSQEYERFKFFEQTFNQLPIGALSLGSFIHDDLKLVPKAPFIGPIRTACLRNNEKVYEILKKSITDESITNKYALLRKLDLQDRRKRLVYSRSEFQKLLDAVENVLHFVENDYKQHPGREWLISSDLCLVDISLGLLLHRLYQLGFENYFWSYGKMPNVESFFLRFKKRHAYQKLSPSSIEKFKDIWQKTPANYIIGAGAGVLGMAVFAAFAHR